MMKSWVPTSNVRANVLVWFYAPNIRVYFYINTSYERTLVAVVGGERF